MANKLIKEIMTLFRIRSKGGVIPRTINTKPLPPLPPLPKIDINVIEWVIPLPSDKNVD